MSLLHLHYVQVGWPFILLLLCFFIFSYSTPTNLCCCFHVDDCSPTIYSRQPITIIIITLQTLCLPRSCTHIGLSVCLSSPHYLTPNMHNKKHPCQAPITSQAGRPCSGLPEAKKKTIMDVQKWTFLWLSYNRNQLMSFIVIYPPSAASYLVHCPCISIPGHRRKLFRNRMSCLFGPRLEIRGEMCPIV